MRNNKNYHSIRLTNFSPTYSFNNNRVKFARDWRQSRSFFPLLSTETARKSKAMRNTQRAKVNIERLTSRREAEFGKYLATRFPFRSFVSQISCPLSLSAESPAGHQREQRFVRRREFFTGNWLRITISLNSRYKLSPCHKFKFMYIVSYSSWKPPICRPVSRKKKNGNVAGTREGGKERRREK